MILEEEGGVAKRAKESSDLGNPARLTYESVALPLSYPGVSWQHPRAAQANIAKATAVQVSRDPAGGSCDFLGILDEIGQGRDQVAGFCCPD
jgi:hypothetical protein